ncbi:hypothetical protein ABZS66_35345 [Dactylosporangium sp. NPDC005572]
MTAIDSRIEAPAGRAGRVVDRSGGRPPRDALVWTDHSLAPTPARLGGRS